MTIHKGLSYFWYDCVLERIQFFVIIWSPELTDCTIQNLADLGAIINEEINNSRSSTRIFLFIAYVWICIRYTRIRESIRFTRITHTTKRLRSTHRVTLSALGDHAHIYAKDQGFPGLAFACPQKWMESVISGPSSESCQKRGCNQSYLYLILKEKLSYILRKRTSVSMHAKTLAKSTEHPLPQCLPCD